MLVDPLLLDPWQGSAQGGSAHKTETPSLERVRKRPKSYGPIKTTPLMTFAF